MRPIACPAIAFVLTVAAPALESRRIREAARLVEVAINRSRNRALQNGRAAGIWIERMTNLPIPSWIVAPVVAYDPEPFTDVVVPMSERITIMELRESTCRWPFGDPSSSDFRFCGAESPIGTPYCAFHSRIAYQPSSDRRKNKD